MNEILSVVRRGLVVLTADEVVCEEQAIERLVENGFEVILIADRNEPVQGQAILPKGNVLRLTDVTPASYKEAWKIICARVGCEWPTRRQVAVARGVTMHVDALEDACFEEAANIGEVRDYLRCMHGVHGHAQVFGHN